MTFSVTFAIPNGVGSKYSIHKCSQKFLILCYQLHPVLNGDKTDVTLESVSRYIVVKCVDESCSFVNV